MVYVIVSVHKKRVLEKFEREMKFNTAVFSSKSSSDFLFKSVPLNSGQVGIGRAISQGSSVFNLGSATSLNSGQEITLASARK